MLFLYRQAPLFIHGFNHKLGRIRRDLNELKDEKLLIAFRDLSLIGIVRLDAVARLDDLKVEPVVQGVDRAEDAGARAGGVRCGRDQALPGRVSAGSGST